MSQNTLKVHDLNEDAEFDENGVEVFDEKALVEEEPSDNDLAEEELLSQGATQRVLDATQLYLGEGNDSNLLIVFYVQIMPDDFVMQLHRF
ncbi:RNA polymerase sigma S factor RpoS [Escherichia coli]|nr:RNA polymerase sigma S factor RpoS [Escherichia coli]